MYSYLYQSLLSQLQFVKVWTDVFVIAVFHSKAFCYCSKLNKTKAFIQMSCVNISCNNSVKLKNSKAVFLSFCKTICYKFFADMKSAEFFCDCIACITNMTATADIVWMQNIKSVNFVIITALCNSAVSLSSKKLCT